MAQAEPTERQRARPPCLRFLARLPSRTDGTADRPTGRRPPPVPGPSRAPFGAPLLRWESAVRELSGEAAGRAGRAIVRLSAAHTCRLLGENAGALGTAAGHAGPAIARPSAARACRLLGVGVAQARWARRGACRSDDRSTLGCSCLLVARSRERAGALATAAGQARAAVFRSSAALACGC